MPQTSLIRALLQPEIYPDRSRSVRLVETHISWVLLTGDYVYKIKKPVCFAFLDFSTLQLRRYFCQEELRLNQRFAPQLYLQVAAIKGTPEQPTFSGSTAAIEYAVKMRQFDREAGFDRLALSHRLESVHIDRFADTVADFHLKTARLTGTAAAGTADRIHAAVLRNFCELSPLAEPEGPGDWLVQLRDGAVQKGRELKSLMQQRAESGFIRECHGDLHLGNIVVIDGQPVPFDCIEFNEEMRWIDVIDEVAFIVMDLIAHNFQEYGYRFLNRYLQITGDYQALALLDYYRVYRAIVRAKVALLSLDPATGDQPLDEAFKAKYRNYVSTAQGCAARRAPFLMITHGLSGSGKSTIAAQIAIKLPAIQLRSDVERKRLAAMNDHLNDALYSEEATRITYDHLAETAAGVLEAGYSVIVDATFLIRSRRDQFRLLAERACVRFLILDTQASLSVLRGRIVQRLRAKNDPSDADLRVLEYQQNHRDPLTPFEIQDSVPILTGEEIDFPALIGQLTALKKR